MAIIQQNFLFDWKEIDELGDLKRLHLVLHNLPDEKLISILYNIRDKGRDKYPIKAMWNSVIAGIVFQHNSIESLRRELLRNIQLRKTCGFDHFSEAKDVVPNSWNYTRFLKKLICLENEIMEMFNLMVSELKNILPGFGDTLSHDGKAINTYAKQKKEGYKSFDGRRDVEANIGIKKYSGITDTGKSWEVVKSWFGYKLHLIVDADYELPIAFDLTKASKSEPVIAHELVDKLAINQPDLVKESQYFLSDRGNDDTKLINKLWKKHKIKPVIDIRNLWKGPDKTRYLSKDINVIYNFKGDVFCVCPSSGQIKSLRYGGYEKDRNGHKYLCPKKYCHVSCKGSVDCQIYKIGYQRISMKVDQRIFTPLARCSYKWKKIYKKRTSVERVNSRIDNVYCFEKHFIRGMKKMKLRLSLAFCVMLAMAIGRVKEKRTELVSSLIKTT